MRGAALASALPPPRRHAQVDTRHPEAAPEELVVLEIMPVIRSRFPVGWRLLDGFDLGRFERELTKAVKTALARHE
jgi:hypothetical protein